MKLILFVLALTFMTGPLALGGDTGFNKFECIEGLFRVYSWDDDDPMNTGNEGAIEPIRGNPPKTKGNIPLTPGQHDLLQKYFYLRADIALHKYARAFLMVNRDLGRIAGSSETAARLKVAIDERAEKDTVEGYGEIYEFYQMIMEDDSDTSRFSGKDLEYYLSIGTQLKSLFPSEDEAKYAPGVYDAKAMALLAGANPKGTYFTEEFIKAIRGAYSGKDFDLNKLRGEKEIREREGDLDKLSDEIIATFSSRKDFHCMKYNIKNDPSSGWKYAPKDFAQVHMEEYAQCFDLDSFEIGEGIYLSQNIYSAIEAINKEGGIIVHTVDAPQLPPILAEPPDVVLLVPPLHDAGTLLTSDGDGGSGPPPNPYSFEITPHDSNDEIRVDVVIKKDGEAIDVSGADPKITITWNPVGGDPTACPDNSCVIAKDVEPFIASINVTVGEDELPAQTIPITEKRRPLAIPVGGGSGTSPYTFELNPDDRDTEVEITILTKNNDVPMDPNSDDPKVVITWSPISDPPVVPAAEPTECTGRSCVIPKGDEPFSAQIFVTVGEDELPAQTIPITEKRRPLAIPVGGGSGTSPYTFELIPDDRDTEVEITILTKNNDVPMDPNSDDPKVVITWSLISDPPAVPAAEPIECPGRSCIIPKGDEPFSAEISVTIGEDVLPPQVFAIDVAGPESEYSFELSSESKPEKEIVTVTVNKGGTEIPVDGADPAVVISWVKVSSGPDDTTDDTSSAAVDADSTTADVDSTTADVDSTTADVDSTTADVDSSTTDPTVCLLGQCEIEKGPRAFTVRILVKVGDEELEPQEIEISRKRNSSGYEIVLDDERNDDESEVNIKISIKKDGVSVDLSEIEGGHIVWDSSDAAGVAARASEDDEESEEGSSARSSLDLNIGAVEETDDTDTSGTFSFSAETQNISGNTDVIISLKKDGEEIGPEDAEQPVIITWSKVPSIDTDALPDADADAVPDADTDAVPDADTDAVPDADTDAVPDADSVSVQEIVCEDSVCRIPQDEAAFDVVINVKVGDQQLEPLKVEGIPVKGTAPTEAATGIEDIEVTGIGEADSTSEPECQKDSLDCDFPIKDSDYDIKVSLVKDGEDEPLDELTHTVKAKDEDEDEEEDDEADAEPTAAVVPEFQPNPINPAWKRSFDSGTARQ
ncbi:MAG: hypothetical protein HOE90_10995 [Bacteriovoracaceae bacterium]|nr:hypothetical protein [Bacteriovoracaceae bacterium]